MTAPGDVIGQAVVNVRTCEKVTERVCDTYPGNRCNNCRGDGTWLDTSNPTTVERLGCDDCKPLWRPVENGDTDE